MSSDELYHYVKEDVRTILEEYGLSFLSDDDFEALIDDCTDQIVYGGKYDVTDYWSYLEELVDERLLLMEQTKGV